MSITSCILRKYVSIGATRTYFERLIKNFTRPFIWMCLSTYFILQGAGQGFISFTELPYYRKMGLDGVSAQRNSVITNAPWTLKGFLALLTDNIHLFGYEKRPYLILLAMIGVTGSILISLLPYSIAQSANYVPALLLFMVSLQISGYDLMCQGKFVEFISLSLDSKGDIWTLNYICLASGQFIPTLLVGTLSDHIDPRFIWIALIPISLQSLIFTLSGCMVNDKIEMHSLFRLNTTQIKKNWKVSIMCFFTGLITMGVVFIAIYGDTYLQFMYGLASSAFLILSALLVLPSVIAKANIYILLIEMLYINITGALEYFYTADPSCLPNGPNFSYSYFRTYTQIISNLSSILGIYIFQVVLTHWNYRSIFIFTTIIRAFASSFDIIIVNRWNIEVGVSDKAMYILGSSIIQHATWLMNVVPISLLMSKLCPRSIAITYFAIYAVFANQGLNMSRFVGMYLIELFGIITIDSKQFTCDFSNLSWLIFVSHIISPLFCALFALWLVPSKKISDPLV